LTWHISSIDGPTDVLRTPTFNERTNHLGATRAK
ncbi:unnamed protein product, partial [Schistosoma curassoni]|uniref:Osmotically inducible protein C n=1 Tax=Schistosoma curassoni TaxID=6186 RepID=A0A183L0Y9_9TREM